MEGFGTVICYCTNDYRFIDKCIAEAKLFSDQIVIPVCDHFFNGEPENRLLLEETYAAHPDCTFVEFAYTPGKLYSPFPTYTPSDTGWIRLWHQTARYIGFLHLKPQIEQVLFLDCDEIPEGDQVLRWLEEGSYRNFNAMRILLYYYALRPTLRAKKLQNLVLLARRASLEPRFFFHPDERYALYRYIEGAKREGVRGVDLKPLFHHYSWVRPSSECLQKADTWGHRDDNDWPDEIRRAFEEKGHKDLFGNADLEFEEIPEPYFDPLSVSIPRQFPPRSGFPHVIKVTPREVFQLELEWSYGDCYSH